MRHSSSASGRLLIIDGDPSFLRALADTIRRRLPGVVVDTALSSQAAVRQLASVQYDVILTSTHLPDVEGPALFTALVPHGGDASIVLMSPGLSPDFLIRAGLSGVHDFILKPIEHNVLIARLQHVLEHRARKREVDRCRRRAGQQAKRVKKVIAGARLRLESYEHVLDRRREALTDAEFHRESLLAALNDVSEAVLLLDSRWHILTFNEPARLALFSAKRREDLEGRCLWDECPDWAESPLASECRRALREAVSVRLEMLLPQSGGWYAIRVVPGAHGVTAYFRDLARDERRADRLAGAARSIGRPTGESRQPDGTADEGAHKGMPSKAAGEPMIVDDRDGRAAARDAERARIAQDLQHDFGTLLSAFKSDLQWLEARLEPLPLLLKVRFMAHLVSQMTDRLARICGEQRPAILEELGLAATLQWHASTFEHRTGVRCATVLKDLDGLAPEIGALAFRLVQELLTNVERHAAASVATVTVTREADLLTVAVKDNGRGIREDAIRSSHAHGLTTLQDRARAVGGEVLIAGIPDQGTTVLVKIPLVQSHSH